jgi:hypothetical protein
LPEEEQLQVLSRSFGLDQADVLAVLAEIGGYPRSPFYGGKEKIINFGKFFRLTLEFS